MIFWWNRPIPENRIIATIMNICAGFFGDSRYLRIDKKPVFAIFRPKNIPETTAFVEMFKRWAEKDGFGGLFLIGIDDDPSLLHHMGFDALSPHSFNIALSGYLKGRRRLLHSLRHRLFRYPRWVIDYADLDGFFKNHTCDGISMLPTAVPNWDNTPRIGRRGIVLSGSTPDRFAVHLRRSVEGFNSNPSEKERILFIKSWNEWAEGNYLEPDLQWGRGWLEAVKDFVTSTNETRRTDGLTSTDIDVAVPHL